MTLSRYSLIHNSGDPVRWWTLAPTLIGTAHDDDGLFQVGCTWEPRSMKNILVSKGSNVRWPPKQKIMTTAPAEWPMRLQSVTIPPPEWLPHWQRVTTAQLECDHCTGRVWPPHRQSVTTPPAKSVTTTPAEWPMHLQSDQCTFRVWPPHQQSVTILPADKHASHCSTMAPN